MNLIVYALLAQGGILMLGIVMWLALVRREVTGARELALLSLACMGWIAADMLGVFVSDIGVVQMLAFAGYPFIAFTPVAWLAFALTYTGRSEQKASWWFRLLLGLAVVTTVVSLTGGLHNLLYLTDNVRQIAEWTGGRPAYAVRPTYGPWFWVHGAASWWATAAGSMLVVSEHMHAMQAQKRISRWIALSALLPLAVNFAYVLRLVPMVKDLTPISLGITISVMSVVLFRYRLSDVRPFRRSALVDALQEAVLVLDDRGRVTDFNPAMRRILDLDESDLARPLIDRASRVGMRLPDELIAVHDADAPPGASPLPPTVELNTEEGVRCFEYRSAPLSDPNRRGVTAGRVILLLDVTEREQQRDAREQAEEALMQANAELLSRNDSLDQFAHTVAHDLKSPANTLRNYVHLLREDADMPDEMRLESLNAIDAVSAKLMSIVDEMLLLAGARRQPVVPVPIAMEHVVDEALDRLEPIIAERGAYVKSTSTWPSVLGHAPWVEEVWVNYVSNALKYGGSPPRVVLGADATADGHARFWVQDNGAGITHVDRDRLFVPFARLHVGGGIEGHGLGLAIVRQIVERLGGTCGLEDSPLGGTTFYFTLPTAERAEVVEAEVA